MQKIFGNTVLARGLFQDPCFAWSFKTAFFVGTGEHSLAFWLKVPCTEGVCGQAPYMEGVCGISRLLILIMSRSAGCDVQRILLLSNPSLFFGAAGCPEGLPPFPSVSLCHTFPLRFLFLLLILFVLSNPSTSHFLHPLPLLSVPRKPESF